MNKQSKQMTWHQPNQNEKDPWRKPQSPPDIDKIIRKFLARIVTFLKGKGSNGMPPSLPTSKLGLQVMAVVLLLVYFAFGIYIVEPAEQAVVTQLGKYVRTESAGPHWRFPFIESVELVNVERQESSTHGGLMLTQDENIVFVEVSIQYRIGNGAQDARNYLFQVSRPIDSVKQATESALRQVIGHSNLDEVLTSGRAQIAEAIKKQVEETLVQYQTGIYISDVVMQPAKAPEEVKNAFDDVIKAREEKVSFVNKAQAYANEIEAKAQGKAQRLIEEALAYKQEKKLFAEGAVARFNLIVPEYKQNSKVTQMRLYLDTIENVLSHSNKILMDVGDGSKNFISVPIEQFLNSSSAALKKSMGDSGKEITLDPYKEKNLPKILTAPLETKNELMSDTEQKSDESERLQKERNS